MLLNARQMAYLGLLLAICDLCQHSGAFISRGLLRRDRLYFIFPGKGRRILPGVPCFRISDHPQSVVSADIRGPGGLYPDSGRLAATHVDEISGVEHLGRKTGRF